MQTLGKYRILAELGRGGFATVYRAEDTTLGREVALKVLDPLLMRDTTWVDRFRREARTVAALDHSRIVPIYEIAEANDRLFIAMKLINGPSLDKVLAERRVLPWEETLRITRDIAGALDYAHNKGVLHRDLKPGNVLLDPQMGAMLTDFGFARLVGESSMSMSLSGGIVGTPHYLAPEIWHNKPATPATDLYALGCVLYEMVLGRKAFPGDTSPAVMTAHLLQPLELPKTWPEGVPAGLTDVLQTALAREPEARFGRVAALVAALDDLAVDPLAEPYAVLEAAVADARWDEALRLAEDIRAQVPGYRDVEALLLQAQSRQDRAQREQLAEQWKTQAHAALEAGQHEVARAAAERWLQLLPEDEDARETQARIVRQLRKLTDRKQQPNSKMDTCPFCDNPNRHGAKYCSTCGNSLSDRGNVATTSPPPIHPIHPQPTSIFDNTSQVISSKSQSPPGSLPQQIVALARRQFDFIFHDRVSLFILLLLMPLLGVLIMATSARDDLVGRNITEAALKQELLDNLGIDDEEGLTEADVGESQRYFPMLEASSLSLLLGFALTQAMTFGAAYEIVKERGRLRQENAAEVPVIPYILSKALVLGTFALVQVASTLFLLSLQVDVSFDPIFNFLGAGILEWFVTLFLAVLASALLALFISVLTSNSTVVLAILCIQCLAQLVFVEFPTYAPTPKLMISHWTLSALGASVDIPKLNQESLVCNVDEQQVLTTDATMRMVKWIQCESAARDELYLDYEHSEKHLLLTWGALLAQAFIWSSATAAVLAWRKRESEHF